MVCRGLRFLETLHCILIFPDPAGVVLRPSNDSVTFIVECAREDLILMPLEHLRLVTSVYRPQTACFIATCRDDLVTLRIERDLGYLILVTLQ